MARKWLYELIYRVPFIPKAWVFGSGQDLLDRLLASGRILPGRAVDLGCGVGAEAIYLAKKGFQVTGVDFSATAIKRARRRARAAGVEVEFLQDDLTNLRRVSGTFDLLVDFGALHDLGQEERDAYVRNVLPLAQSGSLYLLMCFEKNFPSDEVRQRFGEHFSIETLSRGPDNFLSRTIYFLSEAVYLMRRLGQESF